VDRTLSISSTDRLSTPPPFSVGEWFDSSPLRALLAPVIDHLLALPTLSRLYRDMPDDGRSFWERALAGLEVEYRVDEAEAAGIPASGPLLAVANHPFGALDGLILGALLSRARPDVKMIGNSVLSRIPELNRYLLPVDLFGGTAARARNASALRAARRWMAGGGALAVFPSGEVSHPSRTVEGVSDSDWSPAIARLAERAGATVLPVFFQGRNSRLFDTAGHLHPRLRTALLVRELLGKRRQTIVLRVGTPIPSSRLRKFGSAEEMTSYLRLRTYALGGERGTRRWPGPAITVESREPIADPEPVEPIAAEIGRLAASHVLSRTGDYTVCIAGASELPHTLRELGRLREIAFRAVNEGSGRARDVDQFDAHYLHLLVWNHERREVVGSYRVGQTDVILPQRGVDGLYTSTLFHYDRRLLAEIGPALELGRAFVRREYQRDYSPLLLLWKGIGAFVARNPRYRILFGTVSISGDYESLSQQLLAAFLYTTRYRADLGRWVQPRTPPKFIRDGGELLPDRAVGRNPGVGRSPTLATSVVRTAADVDALVTEIESDAKGMPVLLRQYLKLNARLLGFNVDPAFGGVLDGLMMVDLMDVEPQLRVRYMGKSGADRFSALNSRRAIAFTP
jgi:putative hemolysin